MPNPTPKEYRQFHKWMAQHGRDLCKQANAKAIGEACAEATSTTMKKGQTTGKRAQLQEMCKTWSMGRDLSRGDMGSMLSSGILRRSAWSKFEETAEEKERWDRMWDPELILDSWPGCVRGLGSSDLEVQCSGLGVPEWGALPAGQVMLPGVGVC